MPGEDERRDVRRSWPARVVRAGQAVDTDDLSSVTTPEQRVGMMWQLAEQAWSFTGSPLPTYERRTMPARVIRPGGTSR
jgi:hypothetical protein